MDQAEIAGRLAQLHGALATSRRRALLLVPLALVVAVAAASTTGRPLLGLAAGVAAGGLGAIPGWIGRALTRRRLAELERAFPAEVALAMDRYRLARAVERASRWKVFR